MASESTKANTTGATADRGSARQHALSPAAGPTTTTSAGELPIRKVGLLLEGSTLAVAQAREGVMRQLENEEIGAFLLAAFGSLDNVVVAVQALFMYKADHELFDHLLEAMGRVGFPLEALQAQGDRVLATLREQLDGRA